jgi:putative methionine-R-sulfoxide reductase with GAF domain/alkylhydroperoxidase family enzyme
MSADRRQLYRELAIRLAALFAGESDRIANAANMAALLWHELPDLNWAGFYFCRGGELVLGPFNGKPACVRIPFGRGVCGTAALLGTSVLVPNVEEFPGHIACDAQSRSELVVPLVEDGAVLGVLDLDSPLPGRFDEADRLGCEELSAVFVAAQRRFGDADVGRDIDPHSGCRLPLPRREDLDTDGREAYDRLADPSGGSLRGLRGPGGILLHSPELARRSRPVNQYLRHEAGFGGRMRELAILATARELDNDVEWAAHEGAAYAEGVAENLVSLIRGRGDTSGLAETDAVVIELARGMFAARRVGPSLFARALELFGRRRLVDLVALMGNYAATAALLTAFDMQP